MLKRPPYLFCRWSDGEAGKKVPMCQRVQIEVANGEGVCWTLVSFSSEVMCNVMSLKVKPGDKIPKLL
jgi:hypothetical protein